MAPTSLVLLGLGVGGALWRPRDIPVWLAPAVAALLAVGIGIASTSDARAALAPLVQPLAFLLLAVPLAVMLDDDGFFEAAAALAARRRELVGGLWLLSAATVAVLNLDAAVVLLTPLCIRVARRSGLDPVGLSFPPVLLASLASCLLPVSNLTNLIAAHAANLDAADFLGPLGPPTVVAVAVGWWAYRAAFPMTPTAATPGAEPDEGALRRGAAVLAGLVVGFVAGPAFGIAPWVVALVADAVMLGRRRAFPVRAVPWGTAAVAAALAVLTAGAAPHLPVHAALQGNSSLEVARSVGISAAAANVLNNLPAFLLGLRAVPHHASPRLSALLLGVNMGPTVLVTGSLAGLLWLDACRRDGLDVGPRRYASVGLRVGVPALLAATLVFVVLQGA